MEVNIPEPDRLLIECIRRDIPSLDPSRLAALPPEGWQTMLSQAANQRVRPLLWQRLREKGMEHAVPKTVTEELRGAYRQNTLRNLRLYAELRRLLSVLKSEGIPLILLKGIFLTEAVYGNIGLREMNDIDVLARPDDLARIADILEKMGYVPFQPIHIDTIIKTGHHLPCMYKSGYAAFEIHWNLTAPGKRYSIDPSGLWEHAMPVRIAGHDALALSPEDQLLHLCLHTSYHHQFAFGLRPSCDIAATIAHFGSALDWRAVTTRTVRREWQRGVYLALRVAKELAGADVPTEILEELQPADMTDVLSETVILQILSDKITTASIPAPFAELLEHRRLWDKIRIFWQRVFLPREMIANLYSLPMDSIGIYFRYPHRVVDVLRRYGYTLKKYRRGDVTLKAIAERRKQITNWLDVH